MLMHTMTCLVLTAAAELRPVIGLTVIRAVFLPLWALEMGHNAAADLAAAVRRIPCNCNFHPLFFIIFPPFLHFNTDMIIRELSFMTLGPLKTWSTANMQFQKYMAVNEKMSLPFVILQELLFLFFVDTCFHPTAAFCCWLSALRESLV